VSRAELAAALAESEAFASSLNAYVAERLPCFPVDEDTIVLDLSGMSWKFIFQDIVRRSKSLRYITAVSSFTCSKMQCDAFGGMAVLITATSIMGKSTHDILEDFLAEPGLDESGRRAAPDKHFQRRRIMTRHRIPYPTRFPLGQIVATPGTLEACRLAKTRSG
jgi:hypothetical protein